MTQSEYIKFLEEQRGLLDPISAIASGVSSLGSSMDNISEQNAIQNVDRPDLATFVVGNTWQDIINNDDRLNQGFQTIQDNIVDYSGVKNNNNLLNTWNPNSLQNEVNYTSPDGGQVWGDTLGDMGKGAGIGAGIGSIIPGVGTAVGAGVGAVAGALSGIFRGFFGDKNNKENAVKLNKAITKANINQINDFYNTVQQNNQRQQRQAMMNYFQDGGDLGNGVTMFNTGNTHENNPLGGIPQGIAPDNLPNMVEEGELKYDDYIYSARLKANKKLLKDHLLPEKYEGLSFAQIGEKLQKESENRVNDPISKETLNTWMSRLKEAQEEHKAKIEERKLAKALDKMPTEDKAVLMASLMQQVQPQEGIDLSQPMYTDGGKIYIQPSKRGTFTAAAKKRGMGVQEFASKVLANKENYSPAMVKKANFARNFGGHKHVEGGHLFPWGGWTNQDELNDYYNQQYTNFWNNLQGKKGSNINKAYLTGAQARQWVNMLSQGDEKQRALADMLKNQWGDNLDWSENADWEFKNKYNPKGTVTESNPYLEWAGDNTAMKDSLWGLKHVPQLSVDNRYLNTNGDNNVTTYNWLVKDENLTNPLYIFGIPQASLSQIGTRTDVGNNAVNNYYTNRPPWITDYISNLQGPITTNTNVSETTNTDNINNDTDVTTPLDKKITLPRNPEGLRYIPLLGGLGALFQRPNYTYANQLRELAGQYKPIAAPYIGGHRRYNLYDVNLGDAENIALTAAALNANRGQGRATQGALNVAAINAAQKTAAQRNLAWQQANEESKLNTDTYNLGIDKTNLATTQAYDQLNQQIKNNEVNMLARAAAEQDASQTDWANALSNNITNSLNNLGNLDKENWAANQRNALIELLGNEALAKVLGLT